MSPDSASTTLAIVGSFSIDSVLTPDGRWVVEKTGGNALWSALGARMAGLPPRVLAVVGSDYPPDVLETLSASGIDTSAIVRIDRTHPVRVTFAHLADGSRIQPVPRAMIEQLPASVRGRFVDTTVSPQILELGAPAGSDVPSSWLDEVDAWHLPLLPLHRHRSLVERIAGGRGSLQTDCPARSDLLGAPFSRLAPTLSELDVFLPSTSDFDVIAADRSLAEIADELRAAGAKTIVIKAGADGAYVVDGTAIWSVPAYSAAPVDPTGAGDAFCGGFLAGMALTGDLLDAATLGAAAASFAVATEDPLDLAGIDPDLVATRARHLRSQVRKLDHLPAPRSGAPVQLERLGPSLMTGPER
jgi:sugar/nucleoside kinase (ribokinase family)